MSIQPALDTAVLWTEHPQWWLYGIHPQFVQALVRFHQRNRLHLRMAMSLGPELEQEAYWEAEIPRRQADMQAGRAVHLVARVGQGVPWSEASTAGRAPLRWCPHHRWACHLG
jgi:hypothetical protein